MRKPPIKWLDRRIGREGPYLALCLSEGETVNIVTSKAEARNQGRQQPGGDRVNVKLY